jgi:hypothetical protein
VYFLFFGMVDILSLRNVSTKPGQAQEDHNPFRSGSVASALSVVKN